jgi:sortase (surface protein transpeptidase)
MPRGQRTGERGIPGGENYITMRVITLCMWMVACGLVVAASACGPQATIQDRPPPVAPPHATASRPPAGAITRSGQARHSPALTAQPMGLIIPSIGVNAPVEKVGILYDGNLATPTRSPWDDTGWYAAGSSPGEKGSAVIDGHLDRPGGYPAVFWNLRSVRAGDRVLLNDSAGNTLRFRVTRIALYSPLQAPTQQIFADESGTFLNLITCAGDWIPSQHQTTLRLVVYSTLEK